VRRLTSGFSFTTKLGDGPPITLPVEALVGGPRHGISFLLRIDGLEGIPLERPALIEGRYAYSTPHRRLVISPGFSLEPPQSYESAFGKILSPVFEKKCLTYHGQPNQAGAGSHGGIGCESCHGPGMAHIQAVSKGKALGSILNPGKVTGEQAMEVCSQCHTGFSPLFDPLPDGLLISSQVRALRNSECFIQSGGRFAARTVTTRMRIFQARNNGDFRNSLSWMPLAHWEAAGGDLPCECEGGVCGLPHAVEAGGLLRAGRSLDRRAPRARRKGSRECRSHPLPGAAGPGVFEDPGYGHALESGGSQNADRERRGLL